MESSASSGSVAAVIPTVEVQMTRVDTDEVVPVFIPVATPVAAPVAARDSLEIHDLPKYEPDTKPAPIVVFDERPAFIVLVASSNVSIFGLILLYEGLWVRLEQAKPAYVYHRSLVT